MSWASAEDTGFTLTISTAPLIGRTGASSRRLAFSTPATVYMSARGEAAEKSTICATRVRLMCLPSRRRAPARASDWLSQPCSVGPTASWFTTSRERTGRLPRDGGSKNSAACCLRFDPTCTDGTAARYNPLSEIRLGAQEVKDAQNVADMLIDPASNAPRDHWDLTGHDLLTGVILHVIHTSAQKTLAGCLNFLNPPDRDQEKALRAMIETPHTGEIAHAVIAGAAQAVLSKSPNERASVISVATRCLALFRDPIIDANTCESDFSVSDLIHHERPVSLYLTVPPSDLTRTRTLMRLLLAQMGARLTEKLHGADHDSYRRRLLLMLDEFPALGRLDFLQNVLAYAAGYGIKAYLIAQDLSQLYAAYGRDESIVSNCAVRVAFTPNKIETARLLSEMAGVATVRHQHRTRSASQVSVSEPENQRPLLTADEAMRLPGDAALIFVSGAPAIYGTKIRYYLDADFSQRAKIAPPRFSDRIEHEDSVLDPPDSHTPERRPEPTQAAPAAQAPDGTRDRETSIAREVQTNGATPIDGPEKAAIERLL